MTHDEPTYRPADRDSVSSSDAPNGFPSNKAAGLLPADLPRSISDLPVFVDSPRYGPRLQHVPRLSIRYLLLWTATTAAALLIFNLLGLEKLRSEPAIALLLVAIAIVLGWIWMAGAIIGWHALRRTLWILEPGEWLLAGFAGLTAAWLLPCSLLTHLVFDQEMNQLLAAVWMGLIPLGVIFQLGIISRSHSRAWCAIHRANIIVVLLPWCFLFIVFVPPLILPVLIAAVHGDRRRGEARHWLHYSGVTMYGLIVSLSLLLEIVAVVGWLIH